MNIPLLFKKHSNLEPKVEFVIESEFSAKINDFKKVNRPLMQKACWYLHKDCELYGSKGSTIIDSKDLLID